MLVKMGKSMGLLEQLISYSTKLKKMEEIKLKLCRNWNLLDYYHLGVGIQ